MCVNIFFTFHIKYQEQRGAREAAEAAQAADPVGGGAMPARGRQNGAREGVQETGQGQAHYVRFSQDIPCIGWHLMAKDGRDNAWVVWTFS